MFIANDAPAAPSEPVTAIAVTTAALRVRVRPRLRPAKRHDRPTRALARLIVSIANGLQQHIPASTMTPPRTAAAAAASPPPSLLAPRKSRNTPRANVATPIGTRRRGTTPSGRRPARAASTGTRLAERAGTRAAKVAANVPVATITARSNAAKRYGARTAPLTSSIVDLATSRATTAAIMPTIDPTSPVQQPCKASERRTSLSGAPLADS